MVRKFVMLLVIFSCQLEASDQERLRDLDRILELPRGLRLTVPEGSVVERHRGIDSAVGVLRLGQTGLGMKYDIGGGDPLPSWPEYYYPLVAKTAEERVHTMKLVTATYDLEDGTFLFVGGFRGFRAGFTARVQNLSDVEFLQNVLRTAIFVPRK